jgi:hypothetical protein
VGILLSTLFSGKRFDPLELLVELAEKNDTVVSQITFGRSIVEISAPIGLMSVGVWQTSMLGTSSMSSRANISIQLTEPPNLPEFELYSRFSIFAGGIYGFKRAKFSKSNADQDFEKEWCIFVKPEISDRQVNLILQQLKTPLTNLSREALSPQWNIVNISCRDRKLNFVYAKPVYNLDTLEVLMKASVNFVQALSRF